MRSFEENVVVEDDGTVSLNPTEALRLDAKCDGDCEDVTVEWSFQIFNGTHYIEIDGWDLYSTGIMWLSNHSIFKHSLLVFRMFF